VLADANAIDNAMAGIRALEQFMRRSFQKAPNKSPIRRRGRAGLVATQQSFCAAEPLRDPFNETAVSDLEGPRTLRATRFLVLHPSAVTYFHLTPAVVLTLVPKHELRKHIQLVFTDRSELMVGRDYGVVSLSTRRLADL